MYAKKKDTNNKMDDYQLENIMREKKVMRTSKACK